MLAYNLYENISEYMLNTVVTSIETVVVNSLTLPSVTICFKPYLSSSVNLSLDVVLFKCLIDRTVCNHTDFYSYEILSPVPFEMSCFIINDGVNSAGHPNDIKSSVCIGETSGLNLLLYVPAGYNFYYYLNEQNLKPASFEIERHLVPGTKNVVRLEKAVETKLDMPYNNCSKLSNLPDIPYIEQLKQENITYRQFGCIVVCLKDLVKKRALKNNITEIEAYKTLGRTDCYSSCPYECDSSRFSISETSRNLDEVNETIYSKNIAALEKRFDLKINQTELNDRLVEISINYENLKYLKINQTEKTTLSNLVSNLGGSLGLFWGLSFLSFCSFMEFILGIIFRF